jgi:hypothetical protein
MGGVSIISGTLSSVSGTISDLDNPMQPFYSVLKLGERPPKKGGLEKFYPSVQ